MIEANRGDDMRQVKAILESVRTGKEVGPADMTQAPAQPATPLVAVG